MNKQEMDLRASAALLEALIYVGSFPGPAAPFWRKGFGMKGGGIPLSREPVGQISRSYFQISSDRGSRIASGAGYRMW